MYQLESIANLIQEAALGVLGTDLFLFHAPAEAQNCIILMASNDPPAIDPDRPNYFVTKIQTIVRSVEYAPGLVKCQALETALTLYDTDAFDIYIKKLLPLHQARVYRRSDSGLIEFSISYDIRFIVKV